MAFRALSSLITAFFILPSLFAQNIEWQHPLGGTDYDEASSVQRTDDGGYIVAGFSRSTDGDVSGNNGGRDFWVVKLDSVGDTAWTRSLGGSDKDEANSIRQTDDGGYIIAGTSRSIDGDVSGNHGNNDLWVVRLNPTGDTVWTRSLGSSTSDFGRSVQQTSDGGYIVAGSVSSNDGDVSGAHGGYDQWVVKLDSVGDTAWTRALGGSGMDRARSVRQINAGGYVVAGYSSSTDGDVSGNNGSRDFWVVKLTSSGDTLWTRSLGGSVIDEANSIRQTINGGFIVGGNAGSNDGDVSGNNGNRDYWLVKLNNFGDTAWTRSLGGSDNDLAKSVRQTTDGGFIVTGEAESNDGDVSGADSNGCGFPPCEDQWIVKLNSSGDTVWTQALGGSDMDVGYSVQQTSDGGYILAGKSKSTDGDVSDNHGSSDQWVVKLKGQGGGSFIREEEDGPSLAVRPNPTNGLLRIELPRTYQEAQVKVRDLTGRTVKSENVENTSTFRTSIEGDPGLYFVELKTADGRKEVRKVVKE